MEQIGPSTVAHLGLHGGPWGSISPPGIRSPVTVSVLKAGVRRSIQETQDSNPSSPLFLSLLTQRSRREPWDAHPGLIKDAAGGMPTPESNLFPFMFSSLGTNSKSRSGRYL